MERINATFPPGPKAKLRQISADRGLLHPNISNEIATAVAAHIARHQRRNRRASR